MVANKLDGTAIAKSIRERLGTEIAEKQKINPRYKPTLKIIQGKTLQDTPIYYLKFNPTNTSQLVIAQTQVRLNHTPPPLS